MGMTTRMDRWAVVLAREPALEAWGTPTPLHGLSWSTTTGRSIRTGRPWPVSYTDQSIMTFQSQKFQGQHQIVEKLTQLPFQTCQHRIVSFDAQPSVSGGLLVFVIGEILPEGAPRAALLPGVPPVSDEQLVHRHQRHVHTQLRLKPRT